MMLWLQNIIGFIAFGIPRWAKIAILVALCVAALWGYKSCQNRRTQGKLQQQLEKAAEQSQQRIEALEKEEKAIESNANAIITATPKPVTNDEATRRFCADEVRCRHFSCAEFVRQSGYKCP